MKQMIMRAQKHASRAAKHVVNHVRKHKRNYLFGIFGSFAIVKMTFLFAGFLGILSLDQQHASAYFEDPSAICAGVTEIPESECIALLTLYNDTDGDERTINENWGDTGAICGIWYGISCLNNQVTAIFLEENNLVGSMDISLFPFLEGLFARGNTIDNIYFGNNGNLKHINLSHNTLTSFDITTGLESINLSYNNISDISFPKNNRLNEIRLDNNYLSSINLGNLSTGIVELYLAYNQLTYIEKLDNLGDIETLDIAGNTIHPDNISSITKTQLDNIIPGWESTQDLWGCTDPSADNYDEYATADDGSCNPYDISGCTDPSADNYDEYATVDDGSCTYQTPGCTDPLAENYDGSATIDDGSCDYFTETLGCTDSNATNYDGEANTDDGSCEYIYYDCAGLPAPQACSLLSLADPINECGNYYSSINNTQCAYSSKDGGCMANGNVVCEVGYLCGDGTIKDPEQCDDGNTDAGDGCNGQCEIEEEQLLPVCIGTMIETSCTDLSPAIQGIDCRDYYTNISNAQCQYDKITLMCFDSATCTPCGNASIDGDEQCDDGNQIDGDGCTSTCLYENVCGDNIVRDGGETCDDGNTTDGDGCSKTCQLEDRYIDYTTANDITILRGEGVMYDTGKQQFVMPGDVPAFIFIENNIMLGYGGDRFLFVIPYDSTGTIENISNEEDVEFVDVMGIFTMTYSGTLDFPLSNFTFTDNGNWMQAVANSGVYGGWEISPMSITNCEGSGVTTCESFTSDCSLYFSRNNSTQCTYDQIAETCISSNACLIVPICGDTYIGGGEQCDDGNTADGDGCDSSCKTELPVDCVGTGIDAACSSLELADPENECANYHSIGAINQCVYDSKSGGCNGNFGCYLPPIDYCGNGTTNYEYNEECDDGNTTDGDGCSSICKIEALACTGLETKFACSSLYVDLPFEDCQKYYSSSDNSQCFYDSKAGGICGASTSCTPPETEEMASCVGSQIDYTCSSIDPNGLTNPQTDCSLFYSKKSQSQCTYNTGNARCIESTSCATDKWGIYVTYDTNSVVNMAVSHVVFPKDSDCTILNNGGSADYLFQKNGSFYYKLSCPSVNKDQNIILMATVGWLGNHTIYSPNIKDIAKSQVLYTNTVEGKGTTLDAKINEDTSNMTPKEVKIKASKKLLTDLIKEVYGTSAYTESDDTITLKNISLGLENDSTIYNTTTFETTNDKSKVAIKVAENSIITIVDKQQNESQYTGVFISPLDVSTSEKELQHLEEDISGSVTIKSIYKFGSLENIDGSLIAKDLKDGLTNPFVIDFIYNNESFSDSSQVFYSEDGETWTLFTGSTTASGNHLSIITPHLTYYAIVQQPEEEQQNNNQSSASNGGGGGSLLQKDICPVSRDCSDSYYDKLCGKCSLIEKIVDKLPFHNAANLPIGSITNSPYSSELNTAYLRAYAHGITSMPTIQRANVQSPLIRKDMAKMITNFAINILGKDISTGTTCEFTDTTSLTKEAQYYAIAACRLGLMGLQSDGVTSNETFNPDQEVDRAQFGTILSRLLRGNTYSTGEANYYSSHLNALKKAGIMTKIDSPSSKELRGWVMLMMQRIADK